jgi:decaprenyl-phosphate phosphoribosyltransferase
MREFIKLIRVKQWAKNLFVFVPAFFAGVLFDPKTIESLLLGFLCFSLIASGIYILNDSRDVEADRNHPEKRFRPLAAGTIKIPVALSIMVVFIITGLILAYLVDYYFFLIILIYFTLNLGYCLGLKNISILDIMIVASGFLLRTIAGGVIIDVPLSKWLLIMIFLLALFMALAKRLDDFLINEREGKVSRKNVKNYNLNFVHSGITLISGVIIVSYIMYTISEEVITRMHNEHLYFTSVFVVAGIMRYLQITLVEQKSGSPTKILYSDKFILLTLAGWIISFFIIIYLQ